MGAFARALAELIASGAPERFVAKAAKRLRSGRIYIDYLRNVRNATAIGTFSPRARPGAPVAASMSWRELESTSAPPLLSVREAAEIDWAGRDPWKGFQEVRQSIINPMCSRVGLPS